ncbi:hypothetical protein HGA07_09900 [Nocardia veterana]|uniref:Uncharacterized protein n=1 Tax=Nocardia veterana TaxID=132249 RepID=A0A7X6LXF1_9NOCA|nr:hypothetical protein [Nocardia veterana]
MGIREFIERMTRRRGAGADTSDRRERNRRAAREIASLRRANERSRPWEGNPYGDAGTRGISG